MKKIYCYLFFATFLFFSVRTNAQNSNKDSSSNGQPDDRISMSTENWLKDATTITFYHPKDSQKKWKGNSFNGLRIIYEPQFGIIFQTVENRITVNNFDGFNKIGVETNLCKGYVSLQTLLIYPTTVTLDNKSPLVTNHNTIDSSGKVKVDYGFVIGFSFFDGILAIGFGGVFFDKRDFKNTLPNTSFQSNFWYMNFQPISAIKKAFKSSKRP